MMHGLFAVGMIHVVVGLDNGLALQPPMGYNTWNDLGCRRMSEAAVKEVADKLVSTGLKAAGYNFLNLDDCWHATERDNVTKRLRGDPVRFPSGMKALGDYLHGKGFKFGIYTDRGSKTCAGRPGSLNNEDLDAQTFADWGVDYVKEDNCHASPKGPNNKDVLFAQFGAFRDALNRTGRPIFFSVCGGGDQRPWNDISHIATDPRGGTQLANSWRITPDVTGDFSLQYAALTDNGLVDAAGVGGFNDPDMLLGSTKGATRRLPETWSRTQFSIWAILMAPLLLGSPPGILSTFDLQTYTNAEVLAVNQDSLLKQGAIVEKSSLPFLPGSHIIWARNLSDGSAAMVVVNSGWITRNITCGEACWKGLPFKFGTVLAVRDLWTHGPAHVATAVAGTPYSVRVEGEGASRMFKFTPKSASSLEPSGNGSTAPGTAAISMNRMTTESVLI